MSSVPGSLRATPVITFKKSQGLLVVTQVEGAVVGKLDDFQFDLETHAIYGYRLKGTGMFSKSGGVAASALAQVGRDVVFIRSEEDVDWKHANRNAEQDRAWASQYRGRRVMDRRGTALGEVSDFVFDPASDRVLGLLLDSQSLLPLDGGAATGSAAVIIDGPDAIERVNLGEEPADWWTRLRALRGGEAEGEE